MKKENSILRIFLIVIALGVASSCGPSGNLEDQHSNTPMIKNDGYYKEHESEPSTHPAYTREDDTVKVDHEEKATDNLRNK